MMMVKMMMAVITLDYSGDDDDVDSDSPTKFSDWQSVD